MSLQNALTASLVLLRPIMVEHYGDYVELEIEVESGKILNWKKPTKKEVLAFIKEQKGNNDE